ncbi:MAG: KAP family NTPase [Bacteroidota bacterium]|nr:KAP family NTPase [Bacteroidota bacterium]
MPNGHVILSLNQYKENPDPRYALMLKGRWGCGKTYLVNQWVKEEFENPKKKDDVVLDPIRVSLYGLTETEQITKAIDRQLHPFLYSKFAKVGAALLKIAGKVVLRTDLDMDHDGDKDVSISTSLDSLSFLASKDKDVNPNTLKLIIFDDLERSNIPMKLLLGYINYFVEYCGCHVIIVGDESKITDDEKKILEEFKEKTVGKELEVDPDIDAAIAHFVNEIPEVQWLYSQQALIKRVFVASQCNNLRILRQCLYDFKLQFNEANPKLIEKDRSIMKALLGSFIAVYCEYKGQNKRLLEKWDSGIWAFICRKEESPEKKAINDMASRYNGEKLGGINVLNDEHIKKIVSHIERGTSMKSYIDSLLIENQKVKGALIRLEGFRDMDDDEFKHACDELTQDLLNEKYRQFYPLGKALALFSLFEKDNLYQVNNEVIEKAKETLKSILEKDVKDAETLYSCRNAFWQGMNIIGHRDEASRIHKEITAFFNEVFMAREKELPNKMQLTLLTLNNDNVQALIRIDEESTPDRYAPFSLTPVLKDLDALALMERIRGLKNSNVREFAFFLAKHFKLGYSLGGDFRDRFADDKVVLDALRKQTEETLKEAIGIRRMAFQYLLRVIDGCILRCDGNREHLSENIY